MSTSKWLQFVRQCLLHRTHGDEFRELSELLNEKCQIPGTVLAHIILECRHSFSVSSDPLIPLYIRVAVTSGLAQTSDVLLALIQNWNSKVPGKGLSAETENPGCLSSPDSQIVHTLALVIASNRHSAAPTEIRKIIVVVSKWLIALIGWISEDGRNRYYLAILTLLEALGILFASTIYTEQGLILMGSQKDPELKALLTEALEIGRPIIQLHSRFDAIQKHFSLFRAEITNETDDMMQHSPSIPTVMQFEATIVDDPHMRARASLYIYLNAALCTRPTIDDNSLIGYLNTRYAGDHISMFIDLIIAMFDTLSNAQGRNEGEQVVSLYRSFLMNKIPPLLAIISNSSIEHLPASLCISQALGRIDLGAYPLSAYDMDGRSSLTGVRQEFLFACALHHLIPEATIEDLLGENPMQSLPSHGLYGKDQLVQQMATHGQRVEELVKEVELMEGNAEIVVAAIIQLMHSYCHSKDTLQLKDLCNLILRKPQVIDTMAIFRSPAYILGPLCSLLDNWNWDELHGESQPVYEEFGAILLLVLIYTERYELSPSQLGITSATSFVRQLIEMEATEESLDDLDEARRKHLGDWISALFVADSLSDELTSSCSPHEFYKLLPTLLNQSMEACASEKINIESLKTGFDYLLEPFLLPSLVVSLKWLLNHLWRANSTTKISLSLLQTLMKPASSNEAREIIQTIFSTFARPLHLQLGAVGSEELRKQASVAMTSLKPYLPLKQNSSWTFNLLQIATTSSRDLMASMRQTFHQLLDWTMSLDVNISPPRFDFRVISAAVHLHGVSKVLRMYLQELKTLLGTSKFEAAIDMVASIISAPFPSIHGPAHCLSFREALKIFYADLAKTLKKGDSGFAEAVVRLHRKGEVFSVAVPPQEITLDPADSMGADLSNIDLQTMNLEAGAGNTGVGSAAALQVPQSSEDIDQILEGGASLESLATTALDPGTEDIFGLDGGDIGMMNFDDMDLEGMF